VRDLADKIRIVTDNADAEIIFDEPRPGDVLRLFADSTKARKLLGFAPEIDLEEGLKKLHKWYGSLNQKPGTLLESEVSHNWIIDKN
jgi:UDP-glucose 4-epimerase